jgi:hypothetical protein
MTGLFVVMAGLLVAQGAAPSKPDQNVRWRQHDIQRPKPTVIAPAEDPSKPPADAVILFDGTNLDAWKSASGGPARWKVSNGEMQTVPGAGMIETKQAFGDIQLHLEWAAPSPAVGKGQDRGNSGVFLMGQFEIQVLDSYQAETYADGQAGAIYGQYPPLFNASRPPGQWQTYDIAFRRPRFDDKGELLEPARITVFHDGILIQNNEEPFGPTSWLKWLPYADQGGRGPITLQDHDHPVRYRNIWLREMPERPKPTPEQRKRPAVVSLPEQTLEAYAGRYQIDSRSDAAAVIFKREGDHLTVLFPFRPRPLDILPISATEFDMPDTDGRFTFQKGDDGRVTGVHFRIGDGERELSRVEP